MTSVATTPTLDTKLVTAVLLPVVPNPNIPLSPPYSVADSSLLAVPTPVVSVATTPASETKLVTAVLLPVQPKPKIPSEFPLDGASVTVSSSMGIHPFVASI